MNRRDEDGLGTRCQPRGHRCRVKRRLGSCGAGRKLVGLKHPVRFSLAVVQSLFQEPGNEPLERVKEGEKRPTAH